MKFFDRFKKKDQDNDLKSIFTDLDGKKPNQSKYNNSNNFKSETDKGKNSFSDDRVKYKTYDPYSSDNPEDTIGAGEADVITDDVINSVLDSITNQNIVNEADDFAVEDEATIIDISDDEQVDLESEDSDNALDKDDESEGVEVEFPSENEQNEVIDITDDIVEEEQESSEDKEIYESLFQETTVVGTQIFTNDIDNQLNGFNYSTDINYRVGMEESGIGSIFTITKKELESPINIKRSHTIDEIEYYNDLAGMGYSFAAVCGTSVQGIVICEPQYWNNTMAIRHITVVKDARKQGIAKQLLQKIIETAQHNGFRGIQAEVNSKNGAAIEFFLHNYFHITGTNTTLYSNSDLLKNQVGIFLYRSII